MTVDPVGLEGVAITVDAPDSAASALPTLSILIDGTDEPFVIETERVPGQPSFRAFVPTDGDDHDLEIVATAFDRAGN